MKREVISVLYLLQLSPRHFFRKGTDMIKEVWIEKTNGAGLKYLSKRKVISRRRKDMDIDLAGCLDKAVTIAMYGWSAVLSVAVAAVLFEIWG